MIAWTDTRSGLSDIYAQHLDAAGVPLWTANGIAVCTAGGQQTSPRVVSDNNGGMLVRWLDAHVARDRHLLPARARQRHDAVHRQRRRGEHRGGQRHRTSRHLRTASAASSPAGSDLARGRHRRLRAAHHQRRHRVLTANGVPVCTAVRPRGATCTWRPISAGGVIAWDESRILANAHDFMLRRAYSPRVVTSWRQRLDRAFAVGQPDHSQLCSDGTGGAIIVFNDDRNGNTDTTRARERTSVGAAGREHPGTPLQDQAHGGPTHWRGRPIACPTIIARARATSTAEWSTPDGGVARTLDGSACTGHGPAGCPRPRERRAGRCAAAWQDWRFNNGSTSAQRLSSSGSIQWPTNGTSVCQVRIRAERVRLRWRRRCDRCLAVTIAPERTATSRSA